MKHRLALSLLLLAAQPIAPAAACHFYRYWHFHTPQHCSYSHLARSLRHPIHYPRLLAQIDRPAPSETPAIKQEVSVREIAPAPVAPVVQKTEREIGLEALREKMLEPDLVTPP